MDRPREGAVGGDPGGARRPRREGPRRGGVALPLAGDAGAALAARALRPAQPPVHRAARHVGRRREDAGALAPRLPLVAPDEAALADEHARGGRRLTGAERPLPDQEAAARGRRGPRARPPSRGAPSTSRRRRRAATPPRATRRRRSPTATRCSRPSPTTTSSSTSGSSRTRASSSRRAPPSSSRPRRDEPRAASAARGRCRPCTHSSPTTMTLEIGASAASSGLRYGRPARASARCNPPPRFSLMPSANCTLVRSYYKPS